ncbi:phage protease [Ensifer aridi]|uniref:phage protease n=1 Tax=Ensifer aridi TaxID=1708715 RepID=UPI0015E33830|nr:phage protease [Ensifer aridi]
MTLSAFATLSLTSEQAGDRTSWVHLLPAGQFTGIDGRGPYRIDDANRVIAATRARAGKLQMVVDYEHQSLFVAQNGKPAIAAGWIVGLEARKDGIWGLVEWTEAAAAHLAKREYRYLSPVFHHTASGAITRIVNAGLTNSPNLDQLTALASAEITMGNEKENLTPKLRAAAEILGLPNESDTATIVARIKAIVAIAAELSEETGDSSLAPQAANPDPTKFVPIGDFERAVADANKLRQGITQQAAEDHVSMHVRSGRLAPYLKDWAVALCTQNKPQFDAFIERVGPAFNAIVTPQTKGNKTQTGGGLTEGEVAICTQMGLTAEEYAKARETSSNS